MSFIYYIFLLSPYVLWNKHIQSVFDDCKILIDSIGKHEYDHIFYYRSFSMRGIKTGIEKMV